MKISDLPVGDWFLYNALLHRKVSALRSCRMTTNGALEGEPFLHSHDLMVTTSEDMTASLIHPRARHREFVNAGNTWTIESNGDWNHPRGVLYARRPATHDEDEPGSTFTSANGQRFMDTPSASHFRAVLISLPAPYMESNVATARSTKPLTLKRQSNRAADLDMIFRTHTGGEADITLQGKTENGKAEVTISRLFDPAFPQQPALDFKLQGITLDEARALRDYFDALQNDITETRV
jgi:hypothetical protein